MNPRAFLLTALLGSSTSTAASTAIAQDTPAPNIEVVRDGQGRRCTINHSAPQLRSGPTWTCEEPNGERVRVRRLPEPVVRESPTR
jgi:hypothetical protein